MAKDSDVPQPGPARLTKGAGPDEWLEQAKLCRYLPEADMKRLCEIVKELLMEGMHTISLWITDKCHLGVGATRY
jgi:serine/threonine-protein phosphatase PP1-1